ncbi:MAG: hypothetical protein ACHQZS_05105 [Candidatus Binatales bacterium]|jgi:hypothetical protein
MSLEDRNGDQVKGDGDERGADHESESLTSKLSKELSNWRRRRTTSRPIGVDSGSGNNHSEPARTIKVRGHETLVVRKAKLAPKPPADPASGEG